MYFVGVKDICDQVTKVTEGHCVTLCHDLRCVHRESCTPALNDTESMPNGIPDTPTDIGGLKMGVAAAQAPYAGRKQRARLRLVLCPTPDAMEVTSRNTKAAEGGPARKLTPL